MNAADILIKLQDKMSKRNYDVDVEVDEGTVGTKRYTPPRSQGDRDDYIGNDDNFVDFPYVEDPEPYTTYRSLEGKKGNVREQPEDEAPAPDEGPMTPEDVADVSATAKAGAAPANPPGETGMA